PTKQPCWTREEVLSILAASPPMVRSAFILLAETGMRFGELQWLTWDDIGLQQKILNISAKDNWKPKTGDERSVPLSEAALVVLTDLPRSARWVVTMPPTTRLPQLGQQWTERRLLMSLKSVLKGIGLELAGKLHTFRHSFISHALLCNTPAAVVRKWVGHVDQRTIDLYTHVHDVASRVAMDRLSDDFKNAKPKKEKENE
ncbi:MAG: site-specific integrase, partial [Gemmataceae bacterium]|nr:site-specific integrase [Gemmataceae bacterium]